jgi:hypothetical protein
MFASFTLFGACFDLEFQRPYQLYGKTEGKIKEKYLLIADTLKSDRRHVTIDVNQVEVSHGAVAHRLAGGDGLELFHRTRPRVSVNGQHLVRLVFVALATDAAAKAGLFREADKLLEKRVVGLHLSVLVGLESDGLQLLGSHGHGKLLLLGLGVIADRFDLKVNCKMMIDFIVSLL